MVQLSHPYNATGKTIALTRWTFVSKVMTLLLPCGQRKEERKNVCTDYYKDVEEEKIASICLEESKVPGGGAF